MLIIVTGENKIRRQTELQSILSQFEDQEILILDDTNTTLADLEQYIYPSLFSLTTPIIHTRFILDGKHSDITTDIIKKLQASPTIFLIEEFTIPTPIATVLKKQGVQLRAGEKVQKAKSLTDIFSVTKAITLSDKKARWFAYREALVDQPVEALIGILYWKIKDLILKGGKDVAKYKKLYHELISAHAKAWVEGTPLELAVEKVILEQ
jgi:hypothetical protein